jgi:hypothetical protein
MEEKGPSGLCLNCHNEMAMKFPYSMHAKAGLSCVDCHLLHAETQPNQDVHAMPDHSFTASVTTCTNCHADQMHTTGSTAISTQSGSTAEPETTPTVVLASAIEGKPAPVSPAGFSGLAGLLGLAGGMVLQPWLEKAYHRVNNKKGEKNEPKQD